MSQIVSRIPPAHTFLNAILENVSNPKRAKTQRIQRDSEGCGVLLPGIDSRAFLTMMICRQQLQRIRRYFFHALSETIQTVLPFGVVWRLGSRLGYSRRLFNRVLLNRRAPPVFL